MNYRGAIFDMDGTLTKPIIDFGAIRRELRIPTGDLIDEINILPDTERRRAWDIVDRHEMHALDNVELQEGAAELLAACRAGHILLGLVTRNITRGVETVSAKLGISFDVVVTREFAPVKPHPASVLHILTQWGIPADTVIMVGDYVHDIDCGRAAGTKTCFFHNPNTAFHGEQADYVVSTMKELETIILGP